MDFEKVCVELLSCETESAVDAVLLKYPEFKKSSNWCYLDQRDTNYNITTTQAATGGKAATELMTNMVDAILLKQARLQRLDPKGKDVPTTMYEAVDRLVYNMRGGKLIKAEINWLRQFASKNLVVGVTGPKDTTKKSVKMWPCYTFVDNGEGQAPMRFSSTFLSTSAKNKVEIPFVQGKYNMGSQGVLRYCGRNWYKLIISKSFEGGEWGWTLLRKEPVDGVMPVAQYFQCGGEIPHFDSKLINPFRTQDGAVYDGVTLSSGTVVKLYNYRIGDGFKDYRGAREAFNENLVETILPFKLLDFRITKSDKSSSRKLGIDERYFYGMEYLLRTAHGAEAATDEEYDDKSSVAGPNISVAQIDDPDLGFLEITAIPLNYLPGWLKDSRYRVFHAVNGQVMFKQQRGHLSKLKLGAINDRTVIIVDASKLKISAQKEVWQGDRERVAETDIGAYYLDVIDEAIRTSPDLKKWEETVLQEQLSYVAKEESNDLLQKLFDMDKDLNLLLDVRQPGLISHKTSTKEKHFEGRFSPTFLRVIRPLEGQTLKCPLNKDAWVLCETDAQDDFLTRADKRGNLEIAPEILEQFSVRKFLKSGRLTIVFTPHSGSLVEGKRFDFCVRLNDPVMPIPLDAWVSLTLAPEEEAKVASKKVDAQKSVTTKMGGLPRMVIMTQDGRQLLGQATEKWPQGFNALEGGIVVPSSKGDIYKINYDNPFHQKHLLKKKGDAEKGFTAQKFLLAMRIQMLAIDKELRLLNTDGDTTLEIDEVRKIAARAAASTSLFLTDLIPKAITPGPIE